MNPYFSSDWHIHTEHSCDEASLPMEDLVRACKRQGIVDFGVSDHLHTPINLPDIHRSHESYSRHAQQGFHFGIELSVISQWELDRIERHDYDTAYPPVYGYRSGGPAGGPLNLGLSTDQIQILGIDYVVAGAHWPMYVPCELSALIADYHRQQMFLAADPRVDIIAHPWWWDNRTPENGQQWMADFSLIPTSIHDEFIAALKGTGKSVEINLGMLFCPLYYTAKSSGKYIETEKFRRQYAEYLRRLFESGIPMTIGSDCHTHVYMDLQEATSAALEPVGFKPIDFSVPRFRNT